MKKRIRVGQLMARVKAGGKARLPKPLYLIFSAGSLFYYLSYQKHSAQQGIGGQALENLPVTSPSRVQDLDGRPPGASVMGEQNVLPSSLPEKRYPCSF